MTCLNKSVITVDELFCLLFCFILAALSFIAHHFDTAFILFKKLTGPVCVCVCVSSTFSSSSVLLLATARRAIGYTMQWCYKPI